jgi:hypothetical protein
LASGIGSDDKQFATAPHSGGDNKPVSAESQAPTRAAKSRYDLRANSAYRILPDGGTDTASNSVSAFSLYAHQTGNGVCRHVRRGRIYSITNDAARRWPCKPMPARSQPSPGGQKLFATSSNQGTLYQFGPETNTEGTYESSILDAKSTATWGRIWWRSNGSVQIQTRTGNTEKPDPTWSDWSAAYFDQKGAQISNPKAKYLQWRAVLKSSATPASLNEVSVSFIGRNIAPEVLSITVLPTNGPYGKSAYPDRSEYRAWV